MSFTIKSNKWYGRVWPPERRKIKLMQAVVDYQTPEIEKKVSKALRDHLVYGKPLATPTQNIKQHLHSYDDDNHRCIYCGLTLAEIAENTRLMEEI